MQMDEKTMQFLEEHIPEIAKTALIQAYWKALASGHKVLLAENGHLVEVSPDGTKIRLKSIEPPTLVKKGAIRMIQ